MKGRDNKLPRSYSLAMTDKDWEKFVEEKGYTPTWPPHDGYTRRKNNKKEEE